MTLQVGAMKRETMTTEKAIEILQQHNLWRRGVDNVEATHPELLGLALEKAIEVMKISKGKAKMSEKDNKKVRPLTEGKEKRNFKKNPPPQKTTPKPPPPKPSWE